MSDFSNPQAATCRVLLRFSFALLIKVSHRTIVLSMVLWVQFITDFLLSQLKPCAAAYFKSFPTIFAGILNFRAAKLLKSNLLSKIIQCSYDVDVNFRKLIKLLVDPSG